MQLWGPLCTAICIFDATENQLVLLRSISSRKVTDYNDTIHLN